MPMDHISQIIYTCTTFFFAHELLLNKNLKMNWAKYVRVKKWVFSNMIFWRDGRKAITIESGVFIRMFFLPDGWIIKGTIFWWLWSSSERAIDQKNGCTVKKMAADQQALKLQSSLFPNSLWNIYNVGSLNVVCELYVIF